MIDAHAADRSDQYLGVTRLTTARDDRVAAKKLALRYSSS